MTWARRIISWLSAAAVLALFIWDVQLALLLGHPILYASGFLLAVAALWLILIGARPGTQKGTILPARTIESVERQVIALEALNRSLRASNQELTAAIKEQKSRSEEASMARNLLLCALQNDEPQKQLEKLLKLLAEDIGARGAALWICNPSLGTAQLKALWGKVSPTIRHHQIKFEKTISPSHLRKRFENALSDESPAQIQPDDSEDSENSMPGNIVATLLRNPDTPHVDLIPGKSELTAIMGAVAFCVPRHGKFTQEAIRKLSQNASVLSHSARGIEQKEHLQRSVDEISILHEMSGLIQSVTDMDDLYASLLDMVGKLVPYENCTIFVLEPDHKKLAPRATRGRAVNLIDHIPFEQGSGISGWVAQKKKQLIIEDLTKEIGLLNAELIPPDIRSFVSVPMIVQENVIGVLNVSHSQPHAFTWDDVRVLSILAGQAAVTIERSEVLRSLEQMAITDSLTLLYNRRYFEMRLDNEFKRSKRYGTAVTIMLIDIDHFKQVNDTYGHTAGDRVLTAVAACISNSLRETEIIARYGGEEFIVILPHTRLPESWIAAERVRKAVENHQTPFQSEGAIRVTVSIGMAQITAEDENKEAFTRRADGALYRAKQTGRNRVCSDPPMNETPRT
jgi:diguanylate cyclase (GGDEF)-like protein